MRRWVAFRLVRFAFFISPHIIYPLGQAILKEQERDTVLANQGLSKFNKYI